MKKLSLGVLAVLLAGATLFAKGPEIKNAVKKEKPKHECEGRCQKQIKTGTCNYPDACPDMKTCGGKCS
jgi:hypothetical protein